MIGAAIVSLGVLVLSGVAQQAESVSPAGQAAKPLEDLGELLAPIRKSNEMPALGAAVIVGGKLVALGVDGIRKVGDETKVTVSDLWHLGSCTKAMTATLLAQQVAAGKLEWDTTLGEALPDLRAGMHDDARQITLARLLQHRAGLPSQPPKELWLKLFRYEGSDTEARREVATTMLQQAPEAKLGERFLYSNAGYMIAGAVLERVTGKSWQQLMKAELFTPLGMGSASFGVPGRDKHVDQPWGHVKAERGSQPVFADNPSSLGPAGTVHATLLKQTRHQTLSVSHLGGWRTRELEKRRHQVLKPHRLVGEQSRLDMSRPANYHRDANRIIVTGSFVELGSVVEVLAMIAGVDYYRIASQPLAL